MITATSTPLAEKDASDAPPPAPEAGDTHPANLQSKMHSGDLASLAAASELSPGPHWRQGVRQKPGSLHLSGPARSFVPIDSQPRCCRDALLPCCRAAGYTPISFVRRMQQQRHPSRRRSIAPGATTQIPQNCVPAAGSTIPSDISRVPRTTTNVGSPWPVSQPLDALSDSDLSEFDVAARINHVSGDAAEAILEQPQIVAVSLQTGSGTIAKAPIPLSRSHMPTPLIVGGSNIGSNTPISLVATAPRLYGHDDHEHVTIWNRLEKRKIAGNAAPLGRNLLRYLNTHTECEVFYNQDQNANGGRTGRQRGRGGEPCNPGDRIPIWNKREKRMIAGNAAPLLKNLDVYLAKHADCERYSNQNAYSKNGMSTRGSAVGSKEDCSMGHPGRDGSTADDSSKEKYLGAGSDVIGTAVAVAEGGGKTSIGDEDALLPVWAKDCSVQVIADTSAQDVHPAMVAWKAFDRELAGYFGGAKTEMEAAVEQFLIQTIQNEEDDGLCHLDFASTEVGLACLSPVVERQELTTHDGSDGEVGQVDKVNDLGDMSIPTNFASTALDQTLFYNL